MKKINVLMRLLDVLLIILISLILVLVIMPIMDRRDFPLYLQVGIVSGGLVGSFAAIRATTRTITDLLNKKLSEDVELDYNKEKN